MVTKHLHLPTQNQHAAAKRPNIAPTGCKNGAKKLQNRGQVGPRGAKMEPKWGQNGAKMGPRRPKNRKITKTQQRRVEHATALSHFGRKSGQDGPKLGPKTEPKTTKKRCKNRSKFWCLLGSVFGPFLVDFGRQNGAKLAPKTHQKSISTSEGPFYKKYFNTDGISKIFWFSGTEVGTKNRSKIDIKSNVETRRFGNPILIDY